MRKTSRRITYFGRLYTFGAVLEFGHGPVSRGHTLDTARHDCDACCVEELDHTRNELMSCINSLAPLIYTGPSLQSVRH